MRRNKAGTGGSVERAEANERAARMEAARDIRTRFDCCAECGEVAGIVTGYLRIRDEAFVCGECVKEVSR